MNVHKIGYPVHVRVVDGVPQCWVVGHDHPCVEDDGGWACPVGKALTDAMARDIGAALDRLLYPESEESA